MSFDSKGDTECAPAAAPAEGSDPCPYFPIIHETFERVGDKWTLSVVCALKPGPMRFNALKRRERYNAILCNPPYITSRADPELAASVREHEPSLALFLNENPEEFYFRLARQAVSHLASGGLFAVEVGYDTAWPARSALGKVKQLSRGQGVHDFSGLERVIWGIRR